LEGAQPVLFFLSIPYTDGYTSAVVLLPHYTIPQLLLQYKYYTIMRDLPNFKISKRNDPINMDIILNTDLSKSFRHILLKSMCC